MSPSKTDLTKNPVSFPEKVVARMMEKDEFSRWLGIDVIKADEGYCELQMKVRKEMLNGFDIMHGGISYSLADSAVAFAANSYGKIAVTIDALMHYPAAAKEGDTLTAIAKKLRITNKTGVYDITVKNQSGVDIGIMRGTVYITSKEHFPQKDN